VHRKPNRPTFQSRPENSRYAYWRDRVANVRDHESTRERPVDRLMRHGEAIVIEGKSYRTPEDLNDS